MSLRRVASGLLFVCAMGAACAQDETKPAVPPVEKQMSRKEVTDWHARCFVPVRS
jgi:hypothetical protein